MLELEDEEEDDEEKRPLLCALAIPIAFAPLTAEFSGREELEIDVASIVSKARCMLLPTQANRQWLQESLLRDQARSRPQRAPLTPCFRRTSGDLSHWRQHTRC